ncbi:MAG: lysophospholipid acyltransferase family protein [Acidobacteriota bacterium]
MSEQRIQNVSSSALASNESPLLPDVSELNVLDRKERIGFWLTHRMNLGSLKKLMTFCQRHVGSLWIFLATYNLMNVFGIENVEATSPECPLVLVANHRSFFDMYTVSSVLFRRTKRPMELYFPVRGKFFYDNPLGWFVNFIMGWFSMYPPFFREARDAKKREFDKYSMRRLVQLCSEPSPHVIGFHPEGKRNLTGGTYDFLPAQPGIGKVIYDSHPQVIPVFIAGLGNDLRKQILGNWNRGPKVRIWFGRPIELGQYYEKGNRIRTHKEIADFLMEKIAELANDDMAEFGGDFN